MSPRGRKRKPTKLKLVEGNPGKRPLPDPESEWDPGGEPTPPAAVLRDADALAVWEAYAPMLIEIGVLTQADSTIFGAFCLLTAEFEARPQAFPAARISQMRALASSFGLDPSSRAKLPTKPKDKVKDPAEEFFG